MSLSDLKTSKELRYEGKRLGREGLALLALEMVEEFIKKDNSYKGVIQLAGKLKVICQASKYDSYWDEQVWKGFNHADNRIRNFMTKDNVEE